MTDKEEHNPLIVVDSVIKQFEKLDENMQDPRLMEALELAIKCIADPKIPDAKVPPLMVTLSGYALLFRVKYNENMTWAKTENNASYRKNTYRGLYDGIDNLVDSLKYLVR